MKDHLFQSVNGSLGTVKAGIVSTIRSPGPEFDSWICYHLSTGFSKIYLFFDDFSDEDVAIAEKYPKTHVRIYRRDASLLERWKKSRLWSKFGWWSEKEVMARQILNAEITLRIAKRDGIKWLLHIDADELFLPDKNTIHVGQHFKLLQDQGFDTAVYLNYEGVVEPKNIESQNYFRTTTLFKRNPVVVNDEESIRTHFSWMKGKWFYFAGYWTGKSAVRIAKGVEPIEVTRWYKRNEKRANFDSPIILHYINPTFSLTKKKYEMLGNFDDETFSRKDVVISDPKVNPSNLPRSGPGLKSHRDMRDVFFKSNNDIDLMRQDYFHKMGLSEREREFYRILLVEIDLIKKFLENKQCQGIFVEPIDSPPLLPPLEKTNTCSYAPNVFCFSHFECCNMLYNSRQSLNQRDNPRTGIKYTGNQVAKLI